MNNQDNFFEQFKEAARQSEQQRFPGYEEVWQQVAARLDKESQPKVVPFYFKKWFAVAASLLVVLLIGMAVYNSGKNEAPQIAVKKEVAIPPAVTVDSSSHEQKAIPDNIVSNKITQQESISTSSTSSTSSATPIARPTQNISSPETAMATVALAKEEWVKGLVTDTTGQPIAGASVMINGTNRGVAADSAGTFSLKATAGDLLAVQAIGFDKKSLKVGEQQNMHIALAPTSNALNDVVVVGYGAAKKKEMVSSVTSIQSQQLMASNTNMDVQRQLQGKAAGVAMANSRSKQQKSEAKQFTYMSPGAAATIRIRGNNSIQSGREPLYIINGLPASGNALKQMNPQQIDKIDVLKDASASAIYGSRAQNGVVMITTKSLSKKEQNDLRKFNNQLLQSGVNIEPQPIDFGGNTSYEEYNPLVENPFTSPQVSPLSTFSIDVDNASYTNIRRFINNGEAVPQDAVRIEEMINYFKYQYAAPKSDAPFAAQTEYSDAPWNTTHKLLRIALKAKDIPTEQLPPSNIVFLLDVSGSMNAPNKLPLLKESMKVLVDQLRPHDKVSIVVYAGAAGLVLPATNGDEKQTILNALNKLDAGGSTAGGAGIELAYKTAAENFVKDGNNRVVLATDGDFNVGISTQGDLQRLIEEKRKTGIFLTCLGFGMGNYKDHRLETLADKGNGNYAYIDNMQESNRFLGKEFKGTVFAVAKDVKLQIEFNPAQVQSYRLIGYENRKLNDEDFVNDKIDAGEMGIGHTVTALYEIIPVGVNSTFAPSVAPLKYSNTIVANGNANELATLKFRFKKPDADSSTEMVVIVPNKYTPIQLASEDTRFAASVAWFGLTLRDSKLIADKDKRHIIQLAKTALKYDPDGYRAECIRLMETVK